jgi:hypothetical protein
MLKSDRIYLAKFALDPEMEDQFDDIDLYFDDEIEELAENGELDSLFEHQDDMEVKSNEDQTAKWQRMGRKNKRAEDDKS